MAIKESIEKLKGGDYLADIKQEVMDTVEALGPLIRGLGDEALSAQMKLVLEMLTKQLDVINEALNRSKGKSAFIIYLQRHKIEAAVEKLKESRSRFIATLQMSQIISLRATTDRIEEHVARSRAPTDQAEHAAETELHAARFGDLPHIEGVAQRTASEGHAAQTETQVTTDRTEEEQSTPAKTTTARADERATPIEATAETQITAARVEGSPAEIEGTADRTGPDVQTESEMTTDGTEEEDAAQLEAAAARAEPRDTAPIEAHADRTDSEEYTAQTEATKARPEASTVKIEGREGHAARTETEVTTDRTKEEHVTQTEATHEGHTTQPEASNAATGQFRGDRDIEQRKQSLKVVFNDIYQRSITLPLSAEDCLLWKATLSISCSCTARAKSVIKDLRMLESTALVLGQETGTG
ncbi:hypothetical protein C8R47DRAFT_1160808 [Mycena vitilis]|nr:hypothetical protein C8R47DRAFT_1160808 [Mycena vitilis]